jgi:sugar lactone lactonase YvrE
VEITRVGEFSLQWGESLVWDDRRQRLYFVDCFANVIHWIEAGSVELQTLPTPSMPTGLVPTVDGRLVVVLEDGLFVVDPDSGRCDLVSPYPEEIGGRCNDACAALDGNLVTGKLRSTETTWTQAPPPRRCSPERRARWGWRSTAAIDELAK